MFPNKFKLCFRRPHIIFDRFSVSPWKFREYVFFKFTETDCTTRSVDGILKSHPLLIFYWQQNRYKSTRCLTNANLSFFRMWANTRLSRMGFPLIPNASIINPEAIKTVVIKGPTGFETSKTQKLGKIITFVEKLKESKLPRIQLHSFASDSSLKIQKACLVLKPGQALRTLQRVILNFYLIPNLNF